MVSGNTPEVVITRQEPSLRDCIREMPSESVLPRLGRSSDFERFWTIFETTAKDNAWPLSLIPDLLRHRASDDMRDELASLCVPSSLKDLQKDLRSRFFPVIDYATVRSTLRATKQYLRESLQEWEKRINDINGDRIDLNNAEGLQLYKDAVLPAYRLAQGKTIGEFMDACKKKEEELRGAYGDQAFPRTHFTPNKVHEDICDQLNSYERALMSTDIKRVLERLRPSDYAPTTGHKRDRIHVISASEERAEEIPQCDHCGKKGHEQKQCWSLFPGLRPSRRSGKQRRFVLPDPKFIGHCVICAALRPDMPAHSLTDCPYKCPNCGPGTHSVSLCPLNHGSGAPPDSDLQGDSDA
jgi:hypothetical protein